MYNVLNVIVKAGALVITAVTAYIAASLRIVLHMSQKSAILALPNLYRSRY